MGTEPPLSCAKIIRAGPHPIALQQVASGAISYLHADHLGSTNVVTDQNGNTEQHLAYFPFGHTRLNTSRSDTNIAYQYTGQERDASTGLSYYLARSYDAFLGRFLSPDSIIPDPLDPQAYNRYSYVLNNPLKYTDPTGHLAEECGDRCHDGGGFGGGGVPAFRLAQVTVTATPEPPLALEDPFFGPDLIGGVGSVIGKGLGALGIKSGSKIADDLAAAAIKSKRIEEIISSASRASRPGSKDSRALQALKKKVDRGDKAFTSLPKTQDAANALIRQIMETKNPIPRIKRLSGERIQLDLFDQATGRGIRTINGEFDTFVNLN